MRAEQFERPFTCAALTDIGQTRQSNQDEAILLPELAFFGVSDGMGGLSDGAAAAAYVKAGMEQLLRSWSEVWQHGRLTPEETGEQLRVMVQMLSDRLFEQGNTPRFYRFGATLAGVLLYQNRAVFVSLGDSRGYVLRKYKKYPEQITEDMNLAGELVRAGEMTAQEALHSPQSSRLTAFVGMQSPATPAVYVTELRPGDRILLCSDGLYGMVDARELARLLRSGRSPRRVCQRLIDRANENGGRDNISAVYIRIH